MFALSKTQYLRFAELTKGILKPNLVWHSLCQGSYINKSDFSSQPISWMTQKQLERLNDGKVIKLETVVRKLRSIGINPIIVSSDAVVGYTEEGHKKSSPLIQIDRDLSPEWQEFYDSLVDCDHKDVVDAYGKKITSRTKIHKEAVSNIKTDDEWLEMLNQTSKTHASILPILPKILHTAKTDHDNGVITDAQLQSAIASVRTALVCPQPVYAPATKSTRVYSTGGVLSLARNLRQSVISEMGWYELDMVACQFLIFSCKFNVTAALPYMQKIINENASLWTLLMAEIPQITSRDDLKTACYSVFFGAEAKSTKIPFVGAVRKAFLAHPLISEMFAVSAEWRRTAIENGTVYDAYDNKITVENADDARSALACVVQSYETILMRIVEFDFDSDSTSQLIYHIHDGCVVSCPSKERLEGTVRMIQKKLDAKCADLGILCRLELKEVKN